MNLKEGNLVYAEVDERPVQCKVVAYGFGGDDSYLISSLVDQQLFVANAIELADTAEECHANYVNRRNKEYALHYESIGTKEALLLHLLHASVNGRQIKDIELEAVTDRASELMQMNIKEYISELNEMERKLRGNVYETKDCI